MKNLVLTTCSRVAAVATLICATGPDVPLFHTWLGLTALAIALKD